jgi:RNA polymerase sigma-70 factor, ECF subfamily
MSEDSELLLRIVLEDDRKAFEAILRKYESPIRAFFRKMCGGDEELANDLAQETFLKAYRGIASFQHNAKFLTWLYAIAKNVFYEHVRRNERFEELHSDDTESTQTADSHLDIANAMLQLNPEERMVLTLSYTDGLTQTEVAELMSIPLGTVKTHALRAKEKLKTLLQPYQERSL